MPFCRRGRRIVEHQVCWMAESSQIAATRTHEGPQFCDLAPLAAFDGASARALNHAVLERKFIAFTPGFR
jgi:hypothetical protein